MKQSIHQFAVNKETWNTKVGIHVKSAFYDLEGFKSGKSSLNAYEINALGAVTGKSLLHLQCHFGQDTLSWSRMGATCTGIDISEAGIAMARKLNSELKLDANFVCCNVLDIGENIEENFDIVYTSYGVLCWLPDLKPWGRLIADRLKRGGVFYMVEFHPMIWMFDYESDTPIMRYPYEQQEGLYEEYQGTYADNTAKMTSKEYIWNHGLGSVINALTDAGLHIAYLKEYDATPYNILPSLKKNGEGLYELPKKLYPLTFEIKATKP